MRRVSAAVVASVAAALILAAAPALAAPSLDVTPKWVIAGQRVRVAGGGCASRAAVVIFLDGAQVATDRADRTGSFVKFVEVPESTAPGSHEVSASCGELNLGPASFQVLEKKFSVDPNSVQPGGTITVSVGGCKPGSRVIVKLDEHNIARGRADEQGNFTTQARIPKRTKAGIHEVSARCAGRVIGSESVEVTPPPYPATANAVNVSHSVVQAGQVVAVSGDKCPTRNPVASLDGRPVALKVAQRSKGKGFTGTVTIPRGTAPGKHSLRAACAAGSAGSTELQVLDAATNASAAERQPFGTGTGSSLAIWAALLAGVAVLAASIRVGRRQRS
jgi:hypothetical protein